MAERLSELDQMKKDFVSHVSHELKTPLGSIQETHNLLLEEIPGPLNSDQRRLIQLNLQSTLAADNFFWVAGLGGHGVGASWEIGRLAAAGLQDSTRRQPDCFPPARFSAAQ